ncbi:MAG: DUF2252 domain-containing protein [Actinomycetota bacterium]|nr:DUF2252 domain-containing protein [Actinomycetota bacterium]
MSTLFPIRTSTVAERAAAGKAVRKQRPRSALGVYTPSSDRPDPVTLLASQETERVAALLPLRHQRMSVNPFAFLRGAAAIMANDLGSMPHTGLSVQLCGDAHLSNLGLFAGPDRRLVFDLNDFDETNPGPFEWDVQRLATSFQVAALTAGHSHSFAATLPRVAAEAYRTAMTEFAGMNDLDLWYFRVDATLLEQWAQESGSKAGQRAVRKTTEAATAKNRWSAVKSLTTMVDGQRRFKDQPPLLTSLSTDERSRQTISTMFEKYRTELLIDRAELLARYHFVDAGHKVVGVGSVGLLAFVLLLQGRDDGDLLVLQLKQAVTSVLEPFTAPSTFPTHGQRVEAGQRLIQATTDAFLGFTEGPDRDYYVRQLRDMKWSPDPLDMNKDAYSTYAGLCGATLARAHARSGDSVAIAAYLGSGDAFDRAITDFASAYTQQNDADFAAYTKAIADGAVSMPTGSESSARIVLNSKEDGSVSVTSA